jgi:hypothetical protein
LLELSEVLLYMVELSGFLLFLQLPGKYGMFALLVDKDSLLVLQGYQGSLFMAYERLESESFRITSSSRLPSLQAKSL